jgi:hypothetical protein
MLIVVLMVPVEIRQRHRHLNHRLFPMATVRAARTHLEYCGEH